MFLKLVILSLLLLTVSLLAMAAGILLKKNGQFPAISIGKNRELKRRGITCPRHDELICHQRTGKRKTCGCQ
ncbi:MAG TPA: hypothetical protein ENF21_09740 [Bacteroidetes bacterium]|nr:hypothetical protein [Bacteroidota bacterium]